jgi:hypothetical protein
MWPIRSFDSTKIGNSDCTVLCCGGTDRVSGSACAQIVSLLNRKFNVWSPQDRRQGCRERAFGMVEGRDQCETSAPTLQALRNAARRVLDTQSYHARASLISPSRSRGSTRARRYSGFWGGHRIMQLMVPALS